MSVHGATVEAAAAPPEFYLGVLAPDLDIRALPRRGIRLVYQCRIRVGGAGGFVHFVFRAGRLWSSLVTMITTSLY